MKIIKLDSNSQVGLSANSFHETEETVGYFNMGYSNGTETKYALKIFNSQTNRRQRILPFYTKNTRLKTSNPVVIECQSVEMKEHLCKAVEIMVRSENLRRTKHLIRLHHYDKKIKVV